MFTIKKLNLYSRKSTPHFTLTTHSSTFPPHSIVVKVLAFSLDPVMRVWLSGAKTNFRIVK
jgi:hypothetical protein